MEQKIPYGRTLVLLAGLALLPAADLKAEVPPPEPSAPLELPRATEAGSTFEPELDTDFIYQRRGRPDPFMPFLAVWTTEDEEEELRGLRRFEPSQLQLTAVIMTPEQPLAMVQDVEGFGHIIRPGTAIGRYGRVVAISANRVTIKERVPGPADDQEHRTIEMVLKKEGED